MQLSRTKKLMNTTNLNLIEVDDNVDNNSVPLRSSFKCALVEIPLSFDRFHIGSINLVCRPCLT